MLRPLGSFNLRRKTVTQGRGPKQRRTSSDATEPKQRPWRVAWRVAHRGRQRSGRGRGGLPASCRWPHLPCRVAALRAFRVRGCPRPPRGRTERRTPMQGALRAAPHAGASSWSCGSRTVKTRRRAEEAQRQAVRTDETRRPGVPGAVALPERGRPCPSSRGAGLRTPAALSPWPAVARRLPGRCAWGGGVPRAGEPPLPRGLAIPWPRPRPHWLCLCP